MKVLCVIGPSGVGKSHIVTELVSRGLVYVTPSVTDRPRRVGEVSLEHRFVSSSKFDAMAAADEFLGTVQLFGLPYRYGLGAVQTKPGKVPLTMLRAPLIAQMRRHYPQLVIYQIEAPYEFSHAQVASRNDAAVGSRLKDYDAEIELGRQLADRIFINQDQTLENMADQLAAAIAVDF